MSKRRVPPRAMLGVKKKLVRCNACNKRLRSNAENWLVHVRADDRSILEYACPDCQTMPQRVQANGWPPADVRMMSLGRGVIAADRAEARKQ